MPIAELLPEPCSRSCTFVRVVRANKVRQAVSLWKAVQTATWRQEDAASGAGVSDAGAPPYKSFLEDHRPQLRFHYGAIEHLLNQILAEEAHWDAFFEHARIKPVLVLYENFAADYEAATRNVLERLGLELPEGQRVRAADAKSSPTGSTTTGRAATPTSSSAPSSTSYPAAGAAA